jgi:hypothetical protein
MLKFAQRAFHGYVSLAQRRPLPVKITSGFVLTGAGDFFAQRLQQRPWDPKRTLAMACYGGFYVSVVAHGWFMLLDRWVNASKFMTRMPVLSKLGNPNAITPSRYDDMCGGADSQHWIK